mmetsp:Transcript_6727/g.16396  ORF Transcript_6727/g.16396 Transcript_6727/m.16396 type:complete len:238 (+) Transcript_6727:662-1375(+)
MKAPTTISAGAVAVVGTAANTGTKKTLRLNMAATTRAVRPVRPPSAMPAHVSLWMMVGEVPRSEPKVVASDAARKAGLLPGSVPVCLSRRSACIPAPNCTPAVSKMQTKSSASNTGSSSRHWSTTSPHSNSCQNTWSVGISTSFCGKRAKPSVQLTHDETPIPSSIAPCTRCATSAPMSSVVSMPSTTSAEVMSPTVTSVCSSATTKLIMRKPMNAWKMPIATVVACFRLLGITFCR